MSVNFDVKDRGTARYMIWQGSPSTSAHPLEYPVWWCTFPSEFDVLEQAGLGRWEGERFVVVPRRGPTATYRYIGEFGGGEALMRLDAIPPSAVLKWVGEK